MEKRIRIFSSENCFDIEDMINKFLIVTHGKLHDIKLSVSAFYDDETQFGHECATALVIYTPDEEEDEKKIKKN